MAQHKAPALTQEQAAQMLANVFDIAGTEPNTVSLELLESYSHYRAERFTTRRIILGLIILVFLLMPLLFLAPEMTIADKTVQGADPKYEIAVHTFLPVESVTADIAGSNIPVYETGVKIYTIEPEISGAMKVVAESINRQIYELNVKVQAGPSDRETPRLLRDEATADRLYLYLRDNDSGIDYEEIYALDDDRNRIEPITWDTEEGFAVFPYPDRNMNIYVPDRAGNVLQLVITMD